MTKKELRSKMRIDDARYKKQRRFRRFLFKLAGRKLKNPRDIAYIISGLCCSLRKLGMPRDDFLARGQQLVGGAAVFFDRDELALHLSDCAKNCSSKSPPVVILTSQFRDSYTEDGLWA